MNKDSKNIFCQYKLVVEQDQNWKKGISTANTVPKQISGDHLNSIKKAINDSKDISPENKKKIISFISQPKNAEGLKNAIEGRQQSSAPNPQYDETWSDIDKSNYEKWKRETPYQVYDMWGNPAKNSTPNQTYDQYGNPSINPEALEREIRKDRKNKSADIDVADEFLHGPKE